MDCQYLFMLIWLLIILERHITKLKIEIKEKGEKKTVVRKWFVIFIFIFWIAKYKRYICLLTLDV